MPTRAQQSQQARRDAARAKAKAASRQQGADPDSIDPYRFQDRRDVHAASLRYVDENLGDFSQHEIYVKRVEIQGRSLSCWEHICELKHQILQNGSRGRISAARGTFIRTTWRARPAGVQPTVSQSVDLSVNQ